MQRWPRQLCCGGAACAATDYERSLALRQEIAQSELLAAAEPGEARDIIFARAATHGIAPPAGLASAAPEPAVIGTGVAILDGADDVLGSLPDVPLYPYLETLRKA